MPSTATSSSPTSASRRAHSKPATARPQAHHLDVLHFGRREPASRGRIACGAGQRLREVKPSSVLECSLSSLTTSSSADPLSGCPAAASGKPQFSGAVRGVPSSKNSTIIDQQRHLGRERWALHVQGWRTSWVRMLSSFNVGGIASRTQRACQR